MRYSNLLNALHWVFTVPKRLGLFLPYDRGLLGARSRCAWETVRDLYDAGLEDRHAAPGIVVSVQTYGDLANWQPHPHALVCAGTFDREGAFTPLALPPAARVPVCPRAGQRNHERPLRTAAAA